MSDSIRVFVTDMRDSLPRKRKRDGGLIPQDYEVVLSKLQTVRKDDPVFLPSVEQGGEPRGEDATPERFGIYIARGSDSYVVKYGEQAGAVLRDNDVIQLRSA